MSIVYLDLLFVINLTANYLLLLMTARVGGREIRRGYFFISSVAGGLYAVAQVLGLEFLGNPLCKLGAGIIMAILAFGNRQGLFRITLLFFGAAATLGGAVWAVELFMGSTLTMRGGVLYSWFDVRLLFLILILSYTVVTSISDRVFFHKEKEIVEVQITAGGQTLKLNALIDTGNTLTELANNKPVIVAEGAACRKILPFDLPLERPVEAFELVREIDVKRFSLLPYRAVGVKNGLMLAVRAEQIRLGKSIRSNMLVALSPTPVSDGGGYQALIGGEAWNS